MAARSGGHHGSCSKIIQASSQPLTVVAWIEGEGAKRRALANSEEETTASANTNTNTTPTLTSPSLPYSSDPHIPFDLIAKILARIPAKLLLRLRCVSKSWNALISDPNFAKEQFRISTADPTRLTQQHLLTMYFRDPIIRDYSLPSVLDCGSVAPQRPLSGGEDCFMPLTGSCHGMVCIGTCSQLPCLLNPCTGKFKHLPPLKPRYQGQDCVRIHGFGYDHVSDSYKVVSVAICGRLSDETDVRVHTLGTDSWREIQGFPSSYPVGCWGKFVGGALNWRAKSNDVTLPSWFIVSLNLKTETYRRLLPPDCVDDHKFSVNTEVLQGCLSILVDDSMAVDVWLMKKYGDRESWTKAFTVPYMSDNFVHRPCPVHFYSLSAIWISEDGDEILFEDKLKLVLFNSKSGTLTALPDQKLEHGCLFAVVYDQSLISPY